MRTRGIWRLYGLARYRAIGATLRPSAVIMCISMTFGVILASWLKKRGNRRRRRSGGGVSAEGNGGGISNQCGSMYGMYRKPEAINGGGAVRQRRHQRKKKKKDYCVI